MRIYSITILSAASLVASVSFASSIIVDPKGQDPAQLALDQKECAELASQVEFDMAKEQAGRSVLRGAAAAGSVSAIAGGSSKTNKRAAGIGAVGGALSKNQAKRTDNTLQNVKQLEAERNCLKGRGYNPIN
jgi:hypothetical protein